MGSAGLQMLGMSLAIIGWLGTIIVCALPMWKVSASSKSNITITSQVIWEGLWMDCETQRTGQMQCNIYKFLPLSQDLLAARTLTVIAIIAGLFPIVLAAVGGKCNTRMSDERSKAKVFIASGVVFLITALLVLVPVCWSTVSMSFYNASTNKNETMELGVSLYLGWGSSGVLLLGGGLLLCTACQANLFVMVSVVGWIISLGPCIYATYMTVITGTGSSWTLNTLSSNSFFLGLLGVIGSVLRSKCCNCYTSNRSRAMARIFTGIFFLLAGVLQFSIVLVCANHNLVVLAEVSRWSASALLIGGTRLCCSILKLNKPDSTIF